MRYRLALVHRALPGASAAEVFGAVYASHARARRAMRAPSRILESLNGPVAAAIRAGLALSRCPRALEALGVPAERARAAGPPPSPRVAAVEFFSFDTVAALGDALTAAQPELAELARARHAEGAGTSWSALEVRELTGVAARPAGLSSDVGLLFALRRAGGLSRQQMHDRWEGHARLVQRHASALGYEYYAQALALPPEQQGAVLGGAGPGGGGDGGAHGAEGGEGASRVAGMGSVVPGATLSPADALGVLTFPSLPHLLLRAASPAAGVANLQLLRDECTFVHAPATAFEIVRWRPVPHEGARAAEVGRAVARPDVAIA